MMVFGTEIPRMMVFLVFAYVIITTAIAFRLGRPLIMLNFVNERLNANYRYSLIRIKGICGKCGILCPVRKLSVVNFINNLVR